MNFSKLSLTKAAGGRAAGRGEEDRCYRPLEESPLSCYAYVIVTVNVEGPGAGDPGVSARQEFLIGRSKARKLGSDGEV